jgi:hypothetical protein
MLAGSSGARKPVIHRLAGQFAMADMPMIIDDEPSAAGFER